MVTQPPQNRRSPEISARILRLICVCLSILAAPVFGLACHANAEMIWRRGALGDPGSLDPHKATTLIESNVLDDLFEGLMSRDAKGALVPGVAASWSIDAEGRVYVFKLRPDARWSNGDPVTADGFRLRLQAPDDAGDGRSLRQYSLHAQER